MAPDGVEMTKWHRNCEYSVSGGPADAPLVTSVTIVYVPGPDLDTGAL
jgi:hypothetical protein